MSRSTMAALPDPALGADDVPLHDSLVAGLGRRGWRIGDDPLRPRWLRLAACHSTFLYEFRQFPISATTLTVLGRVGAAHLALAVADVVVERSRPAEVSRQDRLVAHLPGRIASRIATALAVPESMNLGKGEEPNRSGTPRLAEVVLHQILGAVVLLGGYDTVKQLVVESYDATLDDVLADGVNWWGELTQFVPESQLTVQEQQIGPDHQRSFAVEILDRRNRRGRGEATKRALAKKLAVQDFLRNTGLYGQVIARNGGHSIRRLTGKPREYGLRDDVTAQLATAFGIPSAHRAYIHQALTHKSWAYENQPAVRHAQQNDYQLLANHGSYVIQAVSAAEFTVELLRRTLLPGPDDGAIHTLPEPSVVRMFDRLVPESAVLRGRGETECKSTMKADVFQALVAAAWRFGESGVPEQLRGWILRETLDQSLDSLSRLNRLGAIFAARVTPSHTSTGPSHDARFTATLTFEIGDLQFTRAGSPTPGKKDANRLAAERMYLLTATDPDFRAADLSAGDRADSALLLSALARRMPELTDRDLRRCAADNVLGLGLLAAPDGDLDGFLSWAEEADSLTGPLADDVHESLLKAYAKMVKARPRPKLEQALRELAAWVRDLDTDAEVVVREAPQWTLLRAVASALRAGGARDSRTVAELAGSWPVSGPESASVLPAADAAAIAELLREFPDTAAGAVRFRRLPDGVRIEFAAASPDTADQVRTLAGLLAEMTPGLGFFAGEGTQTVSATYAPDPADRSFATAGRLAAHGLQDRDGVEILANVLHRLKNELTGMEDVTHKAAQASSRTVRYERLADAARHHDAAVHLADHLDRTNRALADADQETVQFDRWLDEYCAAKILEIKNTINVRLVPPAEAGVCEISVSLSLLRGILDNLIKNAVEAMPGGGRIFVNRYTEPGHLFVTVHDEGPGLSDEIREAFRRDGTVSTTKEHGSGMGLWLVRNDVHRLGGTLDDDPAESGQRWIIDLPCENATESTTVAPQPAAVAAFRRTVRVLLVDDQENVARTMAGHLEPIAAEVEFAHDGETALARLGVGHFDVVVTDLQMPPGTWGGLWLLKQMQEQGRRVPVVVLSGEGGQDQTIEALNAGAAGYVRKADAAEKLATVVQDILTDLRLQSRTDLRHLPLPIALGLQRYESETVPNLRIRAGHSALEDALRFLGAVGLGELIHSDPQGPLPRTVRSRQMMLGVWVDLLKTLKPRLPEGSYAGQVIDSLDLDSLVVAKSGRNLVSHRSERPNDELALMLDQIDPVLDQIATALRHITDRSLMIAQTMRLNARRYVVSAYQVSGTGPVLLSVELISGVPLAENAVGLHRTGTDAWIPIDPWITAREGRVRGEWQISIIDGVVPGARNRPAKLSYQPFGDGDKWDTTADEDTDELIRRA